MDPLLEWHDLTYMRSGLQCQETPLYTLTAMDPNPPTAKTQKVLLKIRDPDANPKRVGSSGI